MTEQVGQTELRLLIRGFGHSEKMTRDHILFTSRALQHQFGTQFRLFHTDPLTGVTTEYTYDSFADDGHHPGHDTTLKERVVADKKLRGDSQEGDHSAEQNRAEEPVSGLRPQQERQDALLSNGKPDGGS